MKIAIMNLSGNVGKSTIAKQLLGPRMPDAAIFSVETVNADDGGADATVSGKKFGELQEAVMIADDAIVDVGASNIEDFIRLMKRDHGSHEDYDIYLIPVRPSKKEMRDTIRTIEILGQMGVGPEKIRVVFNRLEEGETLEDAFRPIFAFAESHKRVKLNPKAVINEHPLYQSLQGSGETIDSVVADDTDWKKQVGAAPSHSDERAKAVVMLRRQREAYTAKQNLDVVFAAITK